MPVRTLEHWFQACKTTSRQQFDMILACVSAHAAKHAGRQTELRPDWEHVKYHVMLCGLRGKFALEPYRSARAQVAREQLRLQQYAAQHPDLPKPDYLAAASAREATLQTWYPLWPEELRHAAREARERLSAQRSETDVEVGE